MKKLLPVLVAVMFVVACGIGYFAFGAYQNYTGGSIKTIKSVDNDGNGIDDNLEIVIENMGKKNTRLDVLEESIIQSGDNEERKIHYSSELKSYENYLDDLRYGVNSEYDKKLNEYLSVILPNEKLKVKLLNDYLENPSEELIKEILDANIEINLNFLKLNELMVDINMNKLKIELEILNKEYQSEDY